MLTTAAVKDEWAMRAIVEHASAAATSELLTLLLEINASAALVRECHRIVGDEMTHSEVSLDVLEAAGGSREVTASLRAPTPIQTEPDAPAMWRTLAITASMFCCGETVAVPLFKAMHSVAKRAVAKRALGRILRDEGRHRAFGWALLDELLARTGDAGLQYVRARAAGYVSSTRTAYTYTGPTRPLLPKETAWGLMPPSAYAAAVNEGIDNTIRPRFAARGIVVA